MKWEELTKEQQGEWNDYVGTHQDKFIIMKSLVEDGCPWDKQKRENFGEMTAHIHQTHGIPREAFIDLINSFDGNS